jgi:hypothetical protein
MVPVPDPEAAWASTTVAVVTPPAGSDPDLAEALELRDELLIACREVLLGVGTPEAAALVAHIDALLDLDDEASPGSQR